MEQADDLELVVVEGLDFGHERIGPFFREQYALVLVEALGGLDDVSGQHPVEKGERAVGEVLVGHEAELDLVLASPAERDFSGFDVFFEERVFAEIDFGQSAPRPTHSVHVHHVFQRLVVVLLVQAHLLQKPQQGRLDESMVLSEHVADFFEDDLHQTAVRATCALRPPAAGPGS